MSRFLRCAECERVSREIERAIELELDVSPPDRPDCRCSEVTRVHNASAEAAIIDRAAAAMRAEYDAMPRARGECGHTIVHLPSDQTSAPCFACGWKRVAIAPLLDLAEAAEE